jgi:hypothetical protein
MKFKWQNVLIVFGLIIAVVLLIDFNRRMEELNRLNTKLESVNAEGTSIMHTQEALKTQVAYATSEDAVAASASQSGLYPAGVHPLVLVPDGSVTETPEPPPVAQTETIPNWRIWWELFFGAD